VTGIAQIKLKGLLEALFLLENFRRGRAFQGPYRCKRLQDGNFCVTMLTVGDFITNERAKRKLAFCVSA